MNFEAAPFKLTSEYVALMGGTRSAHERSAQDVEVRERLRVAMPRSRRDRPEVA